MAKITIDGHICECEEGAYILQIARANGIFIPALCYLSGATPTLACRLCMVEIDGKRVYSCNAKAKDGMVISTRSAEIDLERNAIMQTYCVNHPLECGVCDKSGECELQNLTHLMRVNTQNYAIRDTLRETQDWGYLNYDASLCILCERCITAAKDRLGIDALKTVARGGDALDKSLKDSMPKDAYAVWNKMQKSLIARVDENDECINLGECAAVCPTGALTGSAFKYTSNAWELKQIPASNPHSSDCELLYYDVKRKSIADSRDKIYRVSSDINFTTLHAGARFGWDFSNEFVSKNEEIFNKIVNKISNGEIKNIKFNSFITNEEARILELLREKFDLALINDEAARYQKFLQNFSKYAGVKFYSANEACAKNSDFIVVAGSYLRSDAPNLGFAVNNAVKVRKAGGVYFHAFCDEGIKNFGKNFISCTHKAGFESGILLWILQKFGREIPQWLDEKLQKEFEIIDVRNGEESAQVKSSNFARMLGLDEAKVDEISSGKSNFTLILGEDFIKNENSAQLAKLAGLIERYTDFSTLIVPPRTNSLGVALICELGEQKNGNTLGYNEDADIKFGVFESDLDAPSLIQQEGTFTNYDKRVVPTNAAIDYAGYELTDIANALGIKAEFAVDYTSKLGQNFKNIKFDDLENFYDNAGVNHRGYELENAQISAIDDEFEISFACEISPKNEEILIYEANPLHQFSPFTGVSAGLGESGALYIGQELAQNLGIKENAMIKISNENGELSLLVKFDKSFVGAYLPYFDDKINTAKFFARSRFACVKMDKLGGNDE